MSINFIHFNTKLGLLPPDATEKISDMEIEELIYQVQFLNIWIPTLPKRTNTQILEHILDRIDEYESEQENKLDAKLNEINFLIAQTNANIKQLNKSASPIEGTEEQIKLYENNLRELSNEILFYKISFFLEKARVYQFLSNTILRELSVAKSSESIDIAFSLLNKMDQYKHFILSAKKILKLSENDPNFKIISFVIKDFIKINIKNPDPKMNNVLISQFLDILINYSANLKNPEEKNKVLLKIHNVALICKNKLIAIDALNRLHCSGFNTEILDPIISLAKIFIDENELDHADTAIDIFEKTTKKFVRTPKSKSLLENKKDIVEKLKGQIRQKRALALFNKQNTRH